MKRNYAKCVSLLFIERSIYPRSVTKIDNRAFYGCTTLTDVHYSGTKEQWDKINIDTRYNSNAPLLNATIHFAKEITNKPVITSSQVTKSNNTYTFNVNSNTTNKTLNLTATNADSAKIFIWDSLKNMIPL